MNMITTKMKQVYLANRAAYYARYYEPMASYPWNTAYQAYGR